MLDERKANILRAVVEEYIETAQPVGSGHVTRAPGVNVSAATVRNDMALLEQEGYLYQPHTSAGRVPTEKGYRFFVDTLSAPGRLAGAEAQQVRNFFAHAHGELERMLQDTSRLLSNLTAYTAVVVGPPHEAATVRSIQLVSLTPTVALVVVVLSNGVIEKRTVEFDDEADEEALAAAGQRLCEVLVGHPLSHAAGVELEAPDAADPMLVAALRSLGEEAPEEPEVYLAGTSNMAAAFDAVGTVREILRILEQQFVVVSLLKDVLDRGLSVAIGSETGVQPLSDCAVVVAPYEVDGETAGSIGVLGPTRMNYPQAMAAVAVVSDRLGRRLSEG
ncbi:heat-inducible transcriptional repressor HrcA [Rhabdothermincola sediminis]|uniref:heat-inducible transcriptional repressor HrcA n=1 Tax=Rhabdothermincola sediminis TaxID=2751370 RepID=UPI001AA01F53|nr:heat-inducible transcriptional repressor HrcA [Rhabdothermincola sediminis]